MVTKVLWVVTMDAAASAQILKIATEVGAAAVCVRSTSQALPGKISGFHEEGVKVYAWRWPAIHQVPGKHWFAAEEAAYVANTLIPAGLNGYIVDPESEPHRPHDDWNHITLAPLAKEFCLTIKSAAQQRGSPFHFGVTSGCSYPISCPHIPWAEFVAASDALYPQCYWRVDSNDENLPANGGFPKEAFDRGKHAWSGIAQGKAIIPMAGELGSVSPADIAAFATHAAANGIAELHFYAADVTVDHVVYEAIKAI